MKRETRIVLGAALIALATASPVAAGIDLIMGPVDPSEAEMDTPEADEPIELDFEDYVPQSGTISTANPEDRADILRACDDLAAHPGNTENPEGVKGVLFGAMDGPKALPACLEALKVAPNDKRIRYQLARAKQAAGQEAEALRELLELGEKDQYAPALNNLGATYQLGIGVPKNYAEAARWYEAAAGEGFVPSMAVLGWMNQAGRGVPKNNTKAFEWYQMAAEGGAASAMHNLGFMYKNGWGVAPDDTKAADWFEAAAEADFSKAMAMTGWVYHAGRGREKDMTKAVRWYEAAAETGDGSAMGALGNLYDSGDGEVEASPGEAAEWLLRALRHGDARTRDRLLTKSNTLRSETRARMQALLSEAGFDAGPSDGVFGRKTREAVESAFGKR